jgi:microcystin-dependent protein
MDEELLGSIKMFAGTYAPQGYMLCEGQLLSITKWTALYSVIGTTYGGDGLSTFQLPDLRPNRAEYYQLRNPSVKRLHDTDDPGSFAVVADPIVINVNNGKQPDWGTSPRYIISIEGIYPSRD